MKAVMYGGGNIGRGFIGALLSQSGYRVTFVDIAEPVVRNLQEQGRYPVRYVSKQDFEDVWIENVTAINGNDAEAVAAAIAECDIMATAVGARILRHIAPNIVAGLRKRWAAQKAPLNIIICENLMDANKVLEGMLQEHMAADEQRILQETVGLVEASIGRMVPVQTAQMQDDHPLRVCVERYGFLPVDQEAFKGEMPKIRNLVPYTPFDFFIERKLYVHNMGHAVCACLGDLIGQDYISLSIGVPEIRLIVQNAMEESTMALHKKYGASLLELQQHIEDLLYRFTNIGLQDTCQRVSADMARKLGPQDRLIGAARLALEQGILPAFIAIGAAAGVHRYIQENVAMAQERETALQVLREISCLKDDELLTDLILSFYERISGGASMQELCAAAIARKGHDIPQTV